MKSTARVCSLARAGLFLLTFVVALGVGAARAQNKPVLCRTLSIIRSYSRFSRSRRRVELLISRRARPKT